MSGIGAMGSAMGGPTLVGSLRRDSIGIVEGLHESMPAQAIISCAYFSCERKKPWDEHLTEMPRK